MSNLPVVITGRAVELPALVAAAGERAGMRFVEFFAANIRNPHTRRAYARAADIRYKPLGLDEAEVEVTWRSQR